MHHMPQRLELHNFNKAITNITMMKSPRTGDFHGKYLHVLLLIRSLFTTYVITVAMYYFLSVMKKFTV